MNKDGNFAGAKFSGGLFAEHTSNEKQQNLSFTRGWQSVSTTAEPLLCGSTAVERATLGY